MYLRKLIAQALAVIMIGGVIVGSYEWWQGHLSAPSVTAIALDPTAEDSATYVGDIHRIIWSVEPGGVINIFPVSNNTEATSDEAFTVQIPRYDLLSSNADKYKVAVATARKSAFDRAKLLLSTRESPATDLLNAFGSASAVLNGEQYHDVPDKRLIVMSDAVHQTKSLDFLTTDLTPPRDQDIIGALRQTGEMPNLKGVCVWFDGAGASSDGRVGPDKINQIERFWMAFFAAAQAHLTADRYGASLQNYDT